MSKVRLKYQNILNHELASDSKVLLNYSHDSSFYRYTLKYGLHHLYFLNRYLDVEKRIFDLKFLSLFLESWKFSLVPLLSILRLSGFEKFKEWLDTELKKYPTKLESDCRNEKYLYVILEFLIEAGMYNESLKIASFFDKQRQALDVKSLLIIGKAYEECSILETSSEIYTEALEFLESKIDDMYLDYLTCLNAYARVQAKFGNQEVATKKWKWGLDKCRIRLGLNHRLTQQFLNNYSMILLDQGQYEDAEELSRQVLEISIDINGENHQDTLSYHRNIGVAKEETDLVASKNIYQDCLKCCIDYYGKTFPLSLELLNDLGRIHAKTGDLTNAYSYFQEARSLSTIRFGETHPLTINPSVNIGTLLQQENKFQEAEILYINLIEHLQKKYSTNYYPSEIYGIYENLALVLCELSKFQEAEELYRSVVSYRREKFSERSPLFIQALYNLGTFYAEQWKDQEAIAIFQEALRLCERFLKSDHWLRKAIHHNFKILV